MYDSQATYGAQSAHAVLAQLKQFLQAGMPLTEMAHSYHVEALLKPGIGDNAAFQHASLVEINELHHQIAAMGAILRAEQGDPTALRDVGVNIAGFIENRRLGLQLAQALPASVKNDPAYQKMDRLIQETQRQNEKNMALLQQAVALGGNLTPGPLLITGP
ncbi:MAG: hypothetical protein ACYC5Y_14895 [Symbiobacteriia bacterium]